MSTFRGEKSLLSGTARPRELIIMHLYVRQVTDGLQRAVCAVSRGRSYHPCHELL